MTRLLRIVTVIVVLAGGVPRSSAQSPSSASSSQAFLEEAAQLNQSVVRLYGEGKYREAVASGDRGVSGRSPRCPYPPYRFARGGDDRLGRLRPARVLATRHRRIEDEVKRRTVHDGFARGDHRVLHRSDEVGAREHNERGTLFRSIARDAPAAEKPRLEVLEGSPIGQGAAWLGFDEEHHGPQRRDEHLAITEAAGILYGSQGLVHEAGDREIVVSRSSVDAGCAWVRHARCSLRITCQCSSLAIYPDR